MDAIRRYVITLTAAAMLCALVKAITAGRKGQEKILSLVCGIFLLATALGPLGLLRLPDLSDPTAQVQAEADRMASQAEDETKRQMAAIISEEAASYILDKADALGLQLEVQVELDAELLPCGVRLQGAASPYARSQLSGQIETELGIAQESPLPPLGDSQREAGVVLMKESGPVWETLRRLPQRLGKFKYPVLILLLGVLLLLLPRPSGREAEPEATAPAVEERSTLAVEETRLANLLSRIQGAGAVEVMLSLKSGEQIHYQTDTQLQTGGSTEESLRQEDNTVLYGTGSGTQSALVQQVTAPTYQGAIVVCQGADDPGVKLALVQAVASVTGLGTDQITVVKMR